MKFCGTLMRAPFSLVGGDSEKERKKKHVLYQKRAGVKLLTPLSTVTTPLPWHHKSFPASEWVRERQKERERKDTKPISSCLSFWVGSSVCLIERQHHYPPPEAFTTERFKMSKTMGAHIVCDESVQSNRNRNGNTGSYYLTTSFCEETLCLSYLPKFNSFYVVFIELPDIVRK